MQVNLPDIASTKRLGRIIAEVFSASATSQLVLLQGDLGSGKTTLTRFLVEALPGGEEAEVTSPSFTLCNIYPTRPEVWHYDLYRLEDPAFGALPDESLLEALEHFDADGLAQNVDCPILMLVEWPERLDAKFLPDSYIHCRLTAGQNDRRASFTGYGKIAQATLESIAALLAGE